jgi:hypothetical protein
MKKSAETGLLAFLWKLLLGREPLGILWARGGLGNQLFQLSALSVFSKELGFIPLVFAGNLKSARDEFKPQYKNLGIESLFSKSSCKISLSDNTEYFIRFIYHIFNKFSKDKILDESSLIGLSRVDIPRLFFLQDYFESRHYPDCLTDDSLISLISSFPVTSASKSTLLEEGEDFTLMIHVRLTDANQKSNNLAYFERVQKSLLGCLDLQALSSITVYSDDIPESKRLLSDFFPEIPKVFPEETLPLSAVNLLSAFMNYDIVIASRSTLCWWACYLKWRLVDKEVKILADFSDNLMSDNWVRP